MISIKQKQYILSYLGYYTDNIDGQWGPKSINATKSFQKDQNITIDGDFGEKTLNAAKKAINNDEFKKTTTSTSTSTISTVTSSVSNTSNSSISTGTFWDNIKYFKRSDFMCHCGNKYCNGYPKEMEELLIKTADKVREHFGRPMNVSSGVRCTTHNANVGGVYNSRHLLGKAMDFTISGVSASTVVAYVKTLSEIRYTYAIDSSYVHMDVL